MKLRIVENLAEIPAAQWDALRQKSPNNNPFLAHAFLLALQDSGCATPATGWRAQFLTLWAEERLVGAMPLYFKTHSWGEFVFDWAWAEAYQRHGLSYYPKLVSSVPFTPVTGARLLAESDAARAQLIAAALELARDSSASSLHMLFPPETQAREMRQQGMLLRQGVQLHWNNPGYADFAEYLAGMKRDKRKKIQQERRRVNDAGIVFQHLRGEQIAPQHWEFFMRCYTRTHRQFNSPLALNLDFFLRIGQAMPENILLIVALKDDEAIASAFNLYDDHALYGRSWGTLEYHDGLHFETCYYQAIEFCIANKIATFEGGAQGEHKLARGFLPVTTWSAHWLAHPRFSNAVEEFLQRETGGIERYVDELNENSPFKRLPAHE
ncbi:MAG: GNAT family N-acetyltransferase [Hydrogenophilales bacterium 28-61-23]|nr:MAG: GNAT family N-acetyltransferase [Hydrogenophilales bacterium 28-61-23]